MVGKFRNVLFVLALFFQLYSCRTLDGNFSVVDKKRNAHTLENKKNKNYIKAEVIINKPNNLSQHARFWKENQDDDFWIYGWIEYIGVIDSINNVHALRIYDEKGRITQSEIYTVLEPNIYLNINYNDYEVIDPLSSILQIKTRGVTFKLMRINYKNKSKTLKLNEKFKNNYTYTLATSYDTMRKIMKPNVNIAINKLGDYYDVLIVDELSTETRLKYKLMNLDNKTESYSSKSMDIKYFDTYSKIIYLINHKLALVPIMK